MKRAFELCDSPASSTPPEPAAKRRYRDLDSDAASSEASFSCHAPSDSPSNPFGRCKPRLSRALPRATPIDSHLVLRFQLSTQPHNVYRILSVPSEFSFWHLSRLAQFLFGWKDTRFERSIHNRHEKVERKCEHVFTVQKDVVLFANASRPGIIKSGRTVARVMGEIKGLKQTTDDDARWEREECYTLRHLWRRGNETNRAVIYDRDIYSQRKELVHITLCSSSVLQQLKSSPFEALSNVPFVHQGAGLPDDDDDDDFQLDLLQWNEPRAFENFLLKLDPAGGLGVEDQENEEDSEEYQQRLELEREKVKRRMSAPLPKHLPLDDEISERQVEKPKVARKVMPVPEKVIAKPAPKARVATRVKRHSIAVVEAEHYSEEEI